MVKRVRFTTLTLLLALSVAISATQETGHAGLMGRAGRLLQSGVNITITKDPAVKTYCDDAGIPETSIAISAEERTSKQAKMEGRYSSLITKIDVAMQEGGGDASKIVSAAFGTGIGFGIVCAVLAFLSLIFLFFWSISECCCKKTCCIETQKKTESRGWFRWCCYISSAVLGVTTIALTIAWSVYLGKMANRAPEIKCAVAILKSDLINGAQINSTSVFMGLDQADTLFGYYVEMLDSITSIKTNANNIKARTLTTKADNVVSKAESFKSSFSISSYTHPGVFTTSTTVTMGIGLLVKANLDADALKTEAATIADIAKNIDNAATTIANYDSSSVSSSRSALSSARTNLNTGLKDPINKYYNSIVATNGDSDAFAQVKKASQAFMATSIVVMIGFTLFYLLILACNIRDKWHGMKCVSKIIMLLQLLLAVLILIMGAITTAVAVFITYACVAIDGAITTPNYLSTNFKGAKIPSSLVNIVNNCLYEKGDGNLFLALGVDLSSTNKISNITAGLQSYTNFKSNLTGQAAPWVGGLISGNVTGVVTNNFELAGNPSSEDTITGMAKFNTYTCSKDQMYLKTAPAGYTSSDAGDSATTQKGFNFAILRADGKYPAGKYSTRYFGTDCTTLPSGVTETQANAHLVNILTAQDNLKTKVGNLQTDFNTFYTPESDLFTQMKTSVTDLDAIYSKVNKAVDYLNSANSSLPLLMDCRVLNKEVTLLDNILCFRFGEDIYQSSGLGLALGFIIFVYSWIMCCSIRLANPQEGQGEKGAVVYQDGENPQYNNYSPSPAYQDGQNKEQYSHYQ